jgi:hypothetical protein
MSKKVASDLKLPTRMVRSLMSCGLFQAEHVRQGRRTVEALHVPQQHVKVICRGPRKGTEADFTLGRLADVDEEHTMAACSQNDESPLFRGRA